MENEIEVLDVPISVETKNIREKILALEEILRKTPGAVIGDSDKLPLKHSFAEGVYVREIFIPKGYILTGKIHRHSHPNFLMRGEVIVVTEHGGREHLKAPLSMISKPGTKRAIYALEDTVWITVHVTPETDLKKIEDYVIAPTYEDLISGEEEKRIESLANKNCLILALKGKGRDYSCLLNLEADGILLPFKESIRNLKEHGVSLDGLFAQMMDDGVWHVSDSGGRPISSLGNAIVDSDMVGAWVAVAITAVSVGTQIYEGIEAQSDADKLANQQDSIAVLQAQAHEMNAQDIKDTADRNYSRALKDASDLDSIKTLNDSIFDENSKVIQYAYGVQIENIGLETNRLTSAQTAKYASVGADLSAGSPLMEVQNAKELMERQVLITKQNELNEMEKNAMQEKVTDEQFNAQIDKMKDEADSIKLEGTAGYNREMLQAQIALSGGEATADYTRAGGQQSLFKGVAGGISSLGGAYLKAFPPTTTTSTSGLSQETLGTGSAPEGFITNPSNLIS